MDAHGHVLLRMVSISKRQLTAQMPTEVVWLRRAVHNFGRRARDHHATESR